MDYGNGQFRRDEAGAWRYALTGERVPSAVDVRRSGQVVAMFAPELLPDRLLGVRAAAEALGYTLGAFRFMRAKELAPAHVFILEGKPFWTSGVLIEWRRHRISLRDPAQRLPPRHA